jgi:hypothetical protein
MDFNNISIEKLVEYINMELKKDKSISVNKLCDRIGIKKSTLKSKMMRGSYSYNAELRQYAKNNITSNIAVAQEEVAVTKEDNANNNILLNDFDADKLNLLLNNLDGLLKLVEVKDISRNITSLRSGDNRTTSLRIDTGLFEKAKQKAKDNDMTIGEILNRALEDYLNNYL